MAYRIPFNRPLVAGKELYYIAQAVTYGQIAADGTFTKRCSEFLEKRLGLHRVLLTPSCTAALEMAAILCEFGTGDEVILPSYTFVSTASAFTRQGARPVFVDVRPDTLNLDEQLIEQAITPRTKAIVPVHYAGVSCEMDRILDVARKHDIRVVEDAAQGLNGRYRQKPLGSLGDLGAFSFHETKNITCGEGGALSVNDPELVRRAEIIRDKGTNRQQYFRGEVDKYTWVDTGSSYVPSEICSAFLFAQLEHLEDIASRRKRIFEMYRAELATLAESGLLQLPGVPESCENSYHMFYILLPDEKTRDGLMAHLKEHGILAVFHYVPLHTSPMGQRFGYRKGDLPVTEDISSRLLRLPFFNDLGVADQSTVISEVRAYLLGTP